MTYSIVALGDSVVWGQGLRNNQKFRTTVANQISRRLNERVTLRNFSHSGAIIGGRPTGRAQASTLNGEVPSSAPTIRNQVILARDNSNINPNNIDLIILDGGINDVGVTTIINPVTNSNRLRATTVARFTRMVQLLREAANAFPNAKIVVTGYYPIVSNSSNPISITALMVALGTMFGPGIIGGAIAGLTTLAVLRKISAQCRIFDVTSRRRLFNSVRTVNNEIPGDNRITFVNPLFGSRDAVFTPNSALFGLDFIGNPIDPVSNARRNSCNSSTSGFAHETCLRASVGHPNARGANIYRDRIMERLIARNWI